MPEVLHKEPPIKTVRVASEEGVKVIHVRRRPKQKRPLVETGEYLKCPFCSEEHPVVIAHSTRPVKTFSCPTKVGHPLLFLKKEGQDYLESLITRRGPERVERVERVEEETATRVETPRAPEEEKSESEEEERLKEVKRLLREIASIGEGGD